MNIKNTILNTTILLLLCTNLYAKKHKDEKQKKVNIAIVKFRANNCSPAYGRAVTDMLSEKLFALNLFNLYEQSQVEIMAKKKGLSQIKLSESVKASSLGKTMLVEKIVLGSVSKLGRYRIEARVIDVKKETVDLNISEYADSPEDFEDIIDDLVFKIKNHTLGRSEISGIFDLFITGSNLYPLGNLSKGLGSGYGFNAGITLNDPFNINIDISLASGFSLFQPELNSIEYFHLNPIILSFAYGFKVTKSFKFSPALGIGYLLSYVSYDDIEERSVNPYVYKSGFYYNPLVVLKGEMNLLLYHRWYLVVAPAYSLIFETANVGQFFSVDLGVRMLF